MKRILSLLILCTISLISFAQTISDLDSDPSFKGITIGESISKYSSILKFKKYYNGKNAYNVTDSRYLSIFNLKVDEMLVIEKDGKVNAVYLSKKQPKQYDGSTTFQTDELMALYYSLKDRYGSPNVSLDNLKGDPAVAGFRWQGRKVILDIVYLFYGTFGEKNPDLEYMLYERNDDY